MTISEAHGAGVAALAAQRARLASIEDAIDTARPGDLRPPWSRSDRPPTGNLLIIQLGASDDFIAASTYADRVRGGDGNDTLIGATQGTSQLQGGPGDDELRVRSETGNNLAGGPGDDSLIGYSGPDKMRGGSGNDVLSGDSQNDTISGGSGADTLDGGGDDDELLGGDGADMLDGGTGNDTLRGHAGHDVLLGDAGNDRLNGGAGNDSLDGGAGSDRYVFKPGSGHDTIAGFDLVGSEGSGADRDEIVIDGLQGALRLTPEGDSAVRLWMGDGDDRSVLINLNGTEGATPDFTHEQILAALNITLR